MDHMRNDLVEAAADRQQATSATSSTVSRRSASRQWLYRLIKIVYFEHITLIHPERLPRTGPVLYLGLHRNGAVDGFVYNQALDNPVFMISTQLRKNWFARLFFEGIAITRTKDEGDRAVNDAALRQCLDHLRSGGQLFVFPEGTSSLGPRHLPFKSGAIWLLLDYLEGGNHPPLHVVPVGIHYECPWAFRSKVEVVVGPTISTELPQDASRIERLKLMKRRMQLALEEVGINVPSDEYQELIQRLAYVTTLGTPRSYFKSLKALERAIPKKMMDEWRELESALKDTRLWFHQGVPLFPVGPAAFYLIAFLVISPIVVAAIILNLPAFIAGWYAGRKFPDGRNVVSLWKILVGMPVFALWGGFVIVVLLLLGKFLWLASYLASTWVGVKLYYRFKKLAVAVHNGLRQPALRGRMLDFHRTVIQSMANETV